MFDLEFLLDLFPILGGLNFILKVRNDNNIVTTVTKLNTRQSSLRQLREQTNRATHAFAKTQAQAQTQTHVVAVWSGKGFR